MPRTSYPHFAGKSTSFQAQAAKLEASAQSKKDKAVTQVRALMRSSASPNKTWQTVRHGAEVPVKR